MEYKLKEAHRHFFQNVDFKDMVAVTLSMKQYAHGQKLDYDKAVQNLHYFMSRLNRSVFGNAFKRHGKRITVLPVLERSYSGRLHYHLAINNPFPDEPIKFDHLIHSLWEKTDWGYSEIVIKHDTNSGWINYITKLNRHDEVDWENYTT